MSSLEDVKAQIQADIKNNPIILYMKGSKLMPQCGFSAKVVYILKQLNADFETRNVLESDELRQAIKEVSDWPTLPQLYINQEFVGGCDIVTELYDSGELQKLVDNASSTYSSDT